LRRVCQLVMTDEAFHHKFGKIWAHATIPQLDEAERDAVEDWALECFNTLLFNLVNPEQKRLIYPEFGLDWQWVRDAVLEPGAGVASQPDSGRIIDIAGPPLRARRQIGDPSAARHEAVPGGRPGDRTRR